MSTQVQMEQPTARPAVSSRLKGLTSDVRYLPVLGTVVVIALMIIAGGVLYPKFLSPGVMSNQFINNAHLIVLAVGMTFVIITGGIDLSVGAVLALSSIITAYLLQAGWNLWIVLPIAILAGTLIGVFHGWIIHYFKVQPFIATLAGMFFARGMCFLIAPESIGIKDESFKAFRSFKVDIAGFKITTAVIVSLVILAGAFFLLHYTRFGRTVYAIGGSEQSSLMMGLPVARSKIAVYAISGTLAGLAGILFAMMTPSGYALTGIAMELDAIAAVVIGGTLLTGGSGFVLGSLLGVLVLGLIQTFISFQGTLSSWWTKIFIGALLLVFVVLQRLLARKRE